MKQMLFPYLSGAALELYLGWLGMLVRHGLLAEVSAFEEGYAPVWISLTALQLVVTPPLDVHHVITECPGC